MLLYRWLSCRSHVQLWKDHQGAVTRRSPEGVEKEVKERIGWISQSCHSARMVWSRSLEYNTTWILTKSREVRQAQNLPIQRLMIHSNIFSPEIRFACPCDNSQWKPVFRNTKLALSTGRQCALVVLAGLQTEECSIWMLRIRENTMKIIAAIGKKVRVNLTGYGIDTITNLTLMAG